MRRRSGRAIIGAAALIAGLWSPAAAQDTGAPDAAQPERPTVATHAGTVAPGRWEVEAGAEFDGVGQPGSATSAPLTLKLGLRRRLQLSLIGTIADVGPSPALADARIGIKWRFADHLLGSRVALLPEVLVATTGYPPGGALLLIVSHQIGSVEMDLNAGYARRSRSGTQAPRSASLWTASFGGPLAGRFGWTAELFGYPATSGPAGQPASVALLGGPTWQPLKALVFDAGVILPLGGPQPRALYAGVVRHLGRIPLLGAMMQAP